MPENLLSQRGQEVFGLAELARTEEEAANAQGREKSAPTVLSERDPNYVALRVAQEAQDADAIRKKLDIPSVEAGNPARVFEARRGTMDEQVHE